MILGISLAAFTTLHVVISLVGIVTGIVVLFGMLNAKPFSGWTAVFLATTVLTSVTGFLFPITGFTPAHAFGILSLILLAIALFALYLNCFVAVVQSFQKIPFIRALAPTQSEAPFQIAQGILLLAFVCAGIAAVRKFHPAKMSLAAEKMA